MYVLGENGWFLLLIAIFFLNLICVLLLYERVHRFVNSRIHSVLHLLLLQDEQRPRFGVSSWTSDLDASQNGISSSQGKF
jgi:hypothetical protein